MFGFNFNFGWGPGGSGGLALNVSVGVDSMTLTTHDVTVGLALNVAVGVDALTLATHDVEVFKSPLSISDLLAWYSAGSGITEAGTGVSVWADQSGNGNDIAQGTDANRPTATADGGAAWNNKPIIDFNGSSDFLSGAWAAGTTQPWMFAIVVDGGGSSANDGSRILAKGGAFTPWFGHNQTFGNFGLTGDSGGVHSPGSEFVGAFTPQIIMVILNGASSEMYINGGDAAATGTVTGEFTTSGVYVGNWHNGSGREFDGAIGDLLVYDKLLTEGEVNALGNYLADKYGLTWTDVFF